MAIDFGASLDKILATYSQVSQVRAQTDIAKYNAVGAQQQATLHDPQAMNPREAYSSGNAVNPAMMQGAGYQMPGVNPGFVYAGLGVVGLAVLWKALK